jgi:hypothetical protein
MIKNAVAWFLLVEVPVEERKNQSVYWIGRMLKCIKTLAGLKFWCQIKKEGHN